MTKKEKLEENRTRENREVEEVMSLDVAAHPVQPKMYSPETAVDLLNASLEDAYKDELENHTQDEAVVEAMVERQALNDDQNQLREKMEQHNAESPVLSGGDVDAAWDQANEAGTETVSGTAVTPGQNNIYDMGKAMGLTLDRNEPLNISEQRRRKDEERWELDPASTEESA